MKAEKLFLGKIITMDENRPFAEAITMVGDKITYVGDKSVAKRLCDENTKVYDYTGKCIYPGFMEPHCHPGLAGQRAIVQINLWDGESMEDYQEILKKYIKEHPGRRFYIGSGWHEIQGVMPEAKYLDEVSTEVPIGIQTRDGHSMLLNHKAMEVAGIDREVAKQYGTDLIRVYENGEPTGYISEGPVLAIMPYVAGDVNEMKECILWWQDLFIKYGFTAAGNAGIELTTNNELYAFDELNREEKLKIHSFAWSTVNDNTETPEKDIDEIDEKRKKYDGGRFHIMGPKIFLDGVIEAHTGWLLEPYTDDPNYYGVKRYTSKDSLVRLIKAAGKKGQTVHAHTVGDGAVRFFLDGVVEAQEETGNMDMRNIAVHLQQVKKEDIKRFGDYNVIPASGLIWASNDYQDYYQEIEYTGEERVKKGYPGKSFIDAGARMVSHSDYPVSSVIDPVWTLAILTTGIPPGYKPEQIRNKDELISREEALKAITINVAYVFKKEKEMGSLEIGKLGNMTIYDTDFLTCTDEEIGDAKWVATVINGEVFE